MECKKVNRRANICKLCGADAKKDPKRHMWYHHGGRPFERLKQGDSKPKDIDTKILKRGGSRFIGHGFKLGN